MVSQIDSQVKIHFDISNPNLTQQTLNQAHQRREGDIGKQDNSK